MEAQTTPAEVPTERAPIEERIRGVFDTLNTEGYDLSLQVETRRRRAYEDDDVPEEQRVWKILVEAEDLEHERLRAVMSIAESFSLRTVISGGSRLVIS